MVFSLFSSCVSIMNIGLGCMHSDFNRIKQHLITPLARKVYTKARNYNRQFFEVLS